MLSSNNLYMKRSFTRAALLLSVFFSIGANAQVWQDVGADTTELNNYIKGGSPGQDGTSQLLVGPGGKPYYFYVFTFQPQNAPFPVLAETFDGTHWVHMDPGVTSGGGFRTAIDAAGNVYLGVTADTTTTIYKYNGSSWSVFGTGPSGGGILSLAVSRGGTPYFAVITLNPAPAIYKWNGTAFTSLDTTGLGIVYSAPGVGGGTDIQLMVDRQDSLYLTYDQQPLGQPYELNVRKFTGSAWRPVGNALVSTLATKPLAFDSHAIPYAVAASSTPAGFQVEKLSAGNWTPLGPVVPTPGGDRAINLRIGTADTPYVGFTPPNNPDTSLFAYVYKFDGAAWQPLEDGLINAHINPGDFEMSTDSTGHPFVKYLEVAADPEANVPRVKELNHPLKPTAFITFPLGYVYGYYAADFDPGAVSTNTDSADPITYTIADTTIATIVNGKVHPLNVGRTFITANQAADANFFAALPVTVPLAISPGIQQLAFPGIPEKKVGDSDFHALAYTNGGTQLVFQGSDSTIAVVHPDGLIHIRGMGAIIVSVMALGDSLYQPTGSLSQVLFIQPDSTTGGPGSDSAVAKGMTAFVSGGMIIVNVSVPAAQTARLQLFNVVGRLVYNQQVNLAAGINQFQIPVENDRHGIYYLRCAGNDLQLIQSIWIP